MKRPRVRIRLILPSRFRSPRPLVQYPLGFTLLEVLVAMAIVGIALGVLLSGLSLGHRLTLQGDTARQAASLAPDILREVRKELQDLAPREEEIEGHPGWHYRLEIGDVLVRISTPSLGNQASIVSDDEIAQEIEVPELLELTLILLPPGRAAPFVLTTWLPRTGL